MERFAERGGWWVVGQFALIGLYVLALLGTPSITEGIALGFAQIVGVVLVALAVFVGIWALFLLRAQLTAMPAPTEHAVLIESGPYRFVRHPMYGAVSVGMLGLGLAELNPWAVLFALLAFVFFMAKTGHEEGLLVETFPGYREYRSRVPYRLVPWLL
jgi:protein-S-isoprenylcysteine O-methyltransferase Ste14